jgi:dTDP-4-dehydrorhamnose reductase
MKILLFGKNGQVGWELQRSLAPLGELIALSSDSQDLCGDFTDPEGIAETVRALAPDVIVNAAAHTAVDKAESESGLVRAINAQAPALLAQERERLKVINDQIGAPTGADLLADVTAHALRNAIHQSDMSELYHLTAGGETIEKNEENRIFTPYSEIVLNVRTPQARTA